MDKEPLREQEHPISVLAGDVRDLHDAVKTLTNKLADMGEHTKTRFRYMKWSLIGIGGLMFLVILALFQSYIVQRQLDLTNANLNREVEARLAANCDAIIESRDVLKDVMGPFIEAAANNPEIPDRTLALFENARVVLNNPVDCERAEE